jgi:hypothetical protein
MARATGRVIEVPTQMVPRLIELAETGVTPSPSAMMLSAIAVLGRKPTTAIARKPARAIRATEE